MSCVHVHERLGSGMLLTPSGSVHPADRDWLLHWWRDVAMLYPWLGHGLLGGPASLGTRLWREGLEPLGHHALVAWLAERPCQHGFAGWQMGHGGGSRCTPEGCGPMFSSALSASYHVPREMLCSLLTRITATSTSANGCIILF